MGLFDNLRKQAETTEKRTYKKYVVVGQDWSAVSLYWFLREKFGQDNVLIMDHKDFHEDHLFYPGPKVDRGEDNCAVLSRYLDNVETEQTSNAMFYKDQKFRAFTGRVKPYELMGNEDKFINSPCVYDERNLLGADITQNLETIKSESLKAEIKSIAVTEPTDLIEPANFEITLTDHHIYACEQLFFGYGANSFVKFLSDKEKTPKKFIDFSSGIPRSHSLVVTYLSKELVIESEQTLFLPQSQTHDWGHFVLEVENTNEGQLIKAYCNVGEDEVAEEPLSKKIKLLKRTIKRVFESFNEHKSTENIYFLETIPFQNINDDKYVPVKNLHLFGWNAPIEKEFLMENNFTMEAKAIVNNSRSLLSVKQIQRRF